MPSVTQLAHLVFEVSDPQAWLDFATRVVGLQPEPHGAGWSLRCDARELRLQLIEGPADDLVALGWELPDTAALDAVSARLAAAGITVHRDPDCAAERRAQDLAWFLDPAGGRNELVVGPADAGSGFSSRRVPGGFVTGAEGLGHLVLHSHSRAQGEDFYRELLGLQLSDRIVADFGDLHLDLVFLHANARHHSLALGGPLDRRLHHFGLQLGSLDDLGRAWDRAARAGVLATDLGRHPNDQMLSFYATTPSGFQLELGWGGGRIDEHWQPTIHDRIALWGHRPAQSPTQESSR